MHVVHEQHRLECATTDARRAEQHEYAAAIWAQSRHFHVAVCRDLDSVQKTHSFKFFALKGSSAIGEQSPLLNVSTDSPTNDQQPC